MIKTHSVYYPMYQDDDKFIILVTGGRSSGKSLKKDTLVLMSDLTVRKVQDIKIGDRVMGDDGAPRNVLETHNGFGDLYKVSQANAEDYVVNEHHILTLRKKPSAMKPFGEITKKGTPKCPNGRYPQYGELADIPILEYMSKSKRFKNNFLGVKSRSLPYKESEVLIDPYLLGVWLGDGCSYFPLIVNPEPEIKKYIEEFAGENSLSVYTIWKNGAWHLRIKRKNEKEVNTLLENLRAYNLIKNKHIPQEYISNSERVRLELLAGLLDTDGHFDKRGDYEIIQKKEELIKQIKLIADTLGFRTKLSPKRAKIGKKDCGIYYRLNISGDVNRIPCKVERKKCHDEHYKTRSHLTSSLTITKEKEQGEWYGIGVDGNHRYLLADGTVTHNSFMAGTFIERLTFEMGETEGKKIAHQILYTRYTMVSANISVIPEFLDKVDADGTSKFFYKTKTDVVNIKTGSRVMFRGIKTSSGNQTAKLKSIHGITTFVVDEAEEWTNEQEFDTIMLSIRQKGLRNRIIIIMNPTDSNHFIYKRYIKDTHRIEYFDGVPVQISTHPNVLHIHTSYLNNKEHCADNFLKEVEDMKINNPEKYAHIVMGQWADVAEGAIFKKWGIVDSFPEHAKHVCKGLDFGYSCLSGDTLITTKRGDIPIRDVKCGDYVLTRKGYRRVIASKDQGVQETITKTFKVGSKTIQITATDDHRFLINGKWKKYVELEDKDRMFVLSYSKGLSTKDTPTESTRTIISTNGKKMESIIKKDFITQSGKVLMGKYQKVMLFITRTLTRLIIKSKICNLLPIANMPEFMSMTESMKNLQIKKLRCVFALQKKTGKKEERKFLKHCEGKLHTAKDVERNISEQTFIKDSVLRNATTDGSTHLSNVLMSLFARSAERYSTEINTSNQSVAAPNVRMSYQDVTEVRVLRQRKERVYDLTIEGEHEFFANGVLVHNCDETACVKIGVVGNDLYLDEQFYEKGLLTNQIVERLKAQDKDLFVYSDSADPRLIDEIALCGVNIYPVQKGPGSIVGGIDKILTFDNIYVTKRSYNLMEELRSYTWDKDKDGNFINTPIDAYNHLNDAFRYAVMGKIFGKVMHPKKINKDNLGIW